MIEWPSLCMNSIPILWEIIPYALCWSIWRARNDIVFNQKEFSSEGVWDIHLMHIMWWVKARWKDFPFSLYDFTQHFEKVRLQIMAPKVRVVDWHPPFTGLIKFNIDGSSRGNSGISGARGVLRDSYGLTLGMFSMSVGSTWAYVAEVKAILNALLFCKNHDFNNVIIESDSTLAVGWVMNNSNRPWKLLSDINQIDHLMFEVNCTRVFHIFREANTIVHNLAKEGCDRSTPLIELFPPATAMLS